jgi:formate dehydrogenase major subunit/formate dehydrogenase alpha subunit
MPSISIDGRKTVVVEGTSVLEAAHEAGIEIPSLCYHRDLSVVGSCRLCLVDIGEGELAAACTTPVAEGMEIVTETDTVADVRRFVLEMLLRRISMPRRDDDGELMRWVRRYGAQRSLKRLQVTVNALDSDPNPFLRIDINQCILCTHCVRACQEVQGRFVWGVGYRGRSTRIIAGLDQSLLDARCESCGACAAYCPTDAITDRVSFGLGKPEKLVTTTCGYCGVGCQFDLNLKGDRIQSVTSNPEAPVNGMSLCVKGRYGWDFVHHSDRLTRPLVRPHLLEGRNRAADEPRGEWVETDWNRALDLVADRLAAAKREHCPDAIGVLSSAKCTNEENFLMQKFARQVVGTHNVDHCARLCHSSTVAGLAMAFGSGAMSNSMQDIVAKAESMLIIGSNTTEQHPVFGAMIRRAVLRRGVQLIVVDPRRIDITEFAALHLRPCPGSDVALLNSIMQVVLANGWHDQAFIAERCEGF